MDPATLVLVALAMLAMWAYANMANLRANARRPPTHWKFPVLGHLARLDPKRPFKTITDWGVNSLGPVFRLNFGSEEIIILNNYDAIREAFVKQSDNFTDRPDMWLFKELQENGKRGISMSEGTCWKEQRRFVLSGLKDAGFASTTMEDVFQEEVDDLIGHCREQLKADSVVDMNRELRLSVGNVINSILYGFKFRRDDERFVGFQRKLRQVLDLIGMSGLLMTFPCLRHIPYFGYKKLQLIWGEMFAFHTEEIEKTRQRILKETREQKSQLKTDFVSSYLREIEYRAEINDSDHHFDLRQLKFIVADIWAGGQDTAATTLLWCILFLMYDAELQERINQELRASYDHPPAYRDRAAAPLAQAVIMESQRLGNIVPFAITHGAVADTTLFGYEIKKGDKLMPNLWGTHMDPKYFPEPEKFQPERFLNGDGSLKTRVEGFIPFSMGRRQCMGETFSKICMFKVLTSLIWNFKIKFNDRKPRPSLEPRLGMILDPQNYDVELELRET